MSHTPKRRQSAWIPFARNAIAAAVTAACCALAAPASAQDSSIFDDLLLKLKEKGVLTQEEYDALKAARDEERIEQRAERRKEALKAAQQAEKEEKTKETDKRALFGKWNNGFTWETGDKQFSISLAGRVQADYRAFNGTSADTFDIRRAYLGVYGKLWEHFTYDVTADFAQTSAPQLDVAWINWGYWKQAQFRMGQFKMPFSLEELTSSRFIDFQERAMMNALVPAKERGAMIWGLPFTGVTYGLALSNGQGKNTNDTSTLVDGKDFIGRVTFNIAEWVGQQNDAVYHLGADYSYGNIPPSAAPTGRTEGRGVNFFVPTAFTALNNNIERTRTGFEGSFAFGPVKLQGEWINVNFAGNSASAGNPAFNKDITSYYAELLWMITGEKYAGAYRNGTYGRIIPKTNFNLADGRWGAFQLGFRYSVWDATDFGVPACTTGAAFIPPNNGTGFVTISCAGGITQSVGTNEATGYTIGLTWIMNPQVRWYLNYVQTDFETPIVMRPTSTSAIETFNREKAITLRLGLDF
jgi:phosphate-selective porin OprO/OprP